MYAISGQLFALAGRSEEPGGEGKRRFVNRSSNRGDSRSKRINDVLQVCNFGWRPRRSPLGSGHHHVHLPAVAASTYQPARATL